MQQQKLIETLNRQRLIKELREKGLSYAEIGEQLCLSKQRIRVIEQTNYIERFTNYKCVYPKIREWIRTNGVEIKDLERELGENHLHIRAVLAGKQNMNTNDIRFFENATGLPLDVILKRDVEVPNGEKN